MLDFNYTILVQFANFLILLIVLNVLLFKPVQKALNKRRSFVRSLSDKAGEENRRAFEIGKEYEERAGERKKPILAERDALVKEAQAASTNVIEEARRAFTADLDTMKERVRAEADAALARLAGETPRLSEEAAERILGRPRR